jgi:hypothetical protein
MLIPFFLLDQSIQPPFLPRIEKKCRAIEARGGTTLRRSPTPMTTWKMISTEFFLNGLSPLEGDYGDDIFLIIVWEDIIMIINDNEIYHHKQYITQL